MTLDQAAAAVQELSAKPSNDILLKLYALYKQATQGDAPEKGTYQMFDFVGKAKFDAWKAHNNQSQNSAELEYIALVTSLINK